MLRMKTFISKSALFLVYIFAGSYLGLLAVVVFQYPVEMIFENINMGMYYVIGIDLVMITSTSLYSFRVGYKDNNTYENISALQTAAMIGCACGVFVLLALLLDFYAPQNLNAVWMAELILGPEEGWGLDIREIADQYRGLLLAVSALQTFLCGTGMFTGYLLGRKKRVADRREITGRDL